MIQDGFSNIYWRIYVRLFIDASGSTQCETAALKRSSELKDSELVLRNRGCLVSVVLGGVGLWIFSSNPNFDALRPLCAGDSKSSVKSIVVGNTTFHGTTFLSIPVQKGPLNS